MAFKKKSATRGGIPIIKVTPKDLANLTSLEYSGVCKIVREKLWHSNQDPWRNFWALVEFLEKRGLRPEREEKEL